MGVFSSAPIANPKPIRAKKRGGWNIYAQRALARKQLSALAAENIKLRAENEVLRATVQRLQAENDSLWDSKKDPISANSPFGPIRPVSAKS